jgi:hypothetical protein
MGDHKHNGCYREHRELYGDLSATMARRGGGSGYEEDEALQYQQRG